MKLKNIEQVHPHNMYKINKRLFSEASNTSLRIPVVDKHLLDIASRQAGYKNSQELIRVLYREYLIAGGYYDGVDFNAVKLKMQQAWNNGKYKKVLKKPTRKE